MDQCDKADWNENEGIPTGTERAIQTKWRGRHNFELIGDMLLIKSNQKEMYKLVTQSPRQVPVILAESMRPNPCARARLCPTKTWCSSFNEPILVKQGSERSSQMKCEDTLNYTNV